MKKDDLRADKVTVKNRKGKTEFESNHYAILAVGEKSDVHIVRSVGVGGVKECIFDPVTLIAMLRDVADQMEDAVRATIDNAGLPINFDDVMEEAKHCVKETLKKNA